MAITQSTPVSDSGHNIPAKSSPIVALSLRMTWRDWRAGELRFLLVALVIAVAALSSVGFFVDRLRSGLNQNAHQLLGADLVISADAPISQAWLAEATKRSLTITQTVVMSSMAQSGVGDDSQSKLASVKAVGDGYPLRGNLKIADDTQKILPTREIPAAGTVWVDPALLSALRTKIGATLQVGDQQFTIARTIASEPDRGAAFMNFAPRVMLNIRDLAATKLIRYGSRVTYRLLVAGAPEQVQDFQKWVQASIDKDVVKGIRLESLESGRPEMRATLDRAEQFLSLVGLLSALLAAVAVAMAARRFLHRHIDACATLRCLGLRQAEVMALFLIEFTLIGLAGSAIGVVIGFSAHFVLLQWLGNLVSTTLPSASFMPALQGMLTGLLLLLGFALPPILQLRNIPHNRVLRRDTDVTQPVAVITYVLGLATFVSLLLWQAGNIKLGLLTAGGFLGGLALFALCGLLCLRGVRHLRGTVDHPSWRFAITALQRRPGATVVQIVALALGLMALLLLTTVRSDLVTAWQQATPADAPNQFVINIQPDQKPAVAALLAANGVKTPLLYPMIRGRLIQINDTVLASDSYVDERARRLVDREFNLSTMTDIPAENKIVAGRWFNDTKPEASVEQGLAETLRLKLGDKLVFDIAGQRVEAPITSLRKLDWGSMRVNFFVVLNPKLMADTPQSWITAFHLPAQQNNLINVLARDFPNLTVVDVGSVLKQIQDVVDQVVTAIEFLFLFTLASGVLVLYAALAGSNEVRTREAALLRALGATRKQLSHAQWIEFTLIGGVAGLLAAAGASAVGWSLAHFVFNFDWHFGAAVWIAGLSAGAACALLGGLFGLRHVLNHPPLLTLRDAS